MKLVVGLGNPGHKYVGTRHNIGFEVIFEMARRHALGQRPKAKFDGELVETFVAGQKLCLLTPLTFMNLSGQCVKPVMDFYKLELQDLLVVCDDFNLPLAKLRFRPSGSAGGQNGLSDIIKRVGSQDISRLRIGIGQPPPQWDSANYVLGKFDKTELAEMELTVKRAADGVEHWMTDGIQSAMNRFNSSGEPNKKTEQKNKLPEPSEVPGKHHETNDEKK